MNNNEKKIINNRLIFTPSKENWFINHNHGNKYTDNKNLLNIINVIHKRDRYQCYFCGFQSKKFQEIHHLNHNHNDNSEKNLKTICPLCHQYFHLSTCGINDGAIMIFLPEYSQEELNRLCIFLFSIIFSENNNIKEEWVRVANNMYNELYSKSKDLLQHFRSSTIENPTNFELALMNLPKNYALTQIKQISKIVKLLPTKNRFAKQVTYWSKNIDNIDNWISLISEDIDLQKIYDNYKYK